MSPRIISKKRITNFDKIGEGSFGIVYKAKLKSKNDPTINVAVKCLNRKSRNDVFEETGRMESLDHPNIVKLIGITYNGAIPWIIMEYLPHGDLWSYIKTYPGGSMTATGMVKFAYGIACGMAYLHHEAIEKHGDLAARNCLVGPNWSVKIGDFGRYDDDNEYMYYDGADEGCGDGGQLFPIRWMPAENLPTNTENGKPRFTRKGDVWAYGVVLFEIWTRASMPYKDLNNLQVINAISDGDNPMEYRNVSARSYVIDLMNRCWETEPLDRPNFKYIKKQYEENDPDLVQN